MPEIQTLSLGRGQDIAQGIFEYLAEQKWQGALIVAGLGSVTSAAFANPQDTNSPPTIHVTTIEEPAEVVSFVGEVFRKDIAPSDLPAYTFDTPCDYAVHIHVSIGGAGGRVIGGGFRSGTVMRGLNLYIQEISILGKTTH